jgi:hypothetical protein
MSSECQKHHSLSKGTRTHDIISIENYKKLPKSISEIVHNCKDHEMKYTIFCPNHDTICCPVCISTNHKKCDDLMATHSISAVSWFCIPPEVAMATYNEQFKDHVFCEIITFCHFVHRKGYF